MSKQVKAEVVTVVEPKADPILSVKLGGKYRGARQAWYERMTGLDGCPRTEVMANLTADPPALYGARSKHAGTAEPPAGWVRFFERTGMIEWK